MSGCLARGREQARLGALLNELHGGSGGRLALLQGPAGIGKSVLVSWLADEAERRGVTVTGVRATSPELEPPLGLWTRLAVRSGSPVAENLLHGATESGAGSPRALGEVTDLLADLAGRADGCHLVLFEDLHAADAGSVLHLLQAVPVLADVPVLVVGTLRGSAAHPDAQARRLLELLEAAADVVTLEPFTVADVVEVIGDRLAGDRGEDLAAWATATAPVLWEASGGIPFILDAQLGGLQDAPLPEPQDLARLDPTHTRGVLAAVERRLSTLPDTTREVLAALAQTPDHADPALLAQALARDVGADLALARSAGVLTHDMPVPGFVHPTFAEAARASPLAPEIHARLADLLAAEGAGAALVLHHLVQAGSLTDQARLGAVAREVAGHAERVGDLAAAARAYDLVVDTGTADDELHMLLAAGRCHLGSGARDAAWVRARRAADLALPHDVRMFARAAILFAAERGFVASGGEVDELLRIAEHALAEDDPLLVDVLAERSLAAIYRTAPPALPHMPLAPSRRGEPPLPAGSWQPNTEENRRLAVRARALAESLGAGHSIALRAWRSAHTDPDRHAERRRSDDLAVATATGVLARGHATFNAVLDALEGGDRNAVETLTAELDRCVHATGDLGLRWRAGLVEAAHARAAGNAVLAAAAAARAAALGARAGFDGAAITAIVQRAMLEIDAADLGSGVASLREEFNAQTLPVLRAGAALSLAEAGKAEEARELIDGVVAWLVEEPARENRWLPTGALSADTVATLGLVEHAAPLIETLGSYAELIAVDTQLGLAIFGCLARPLARLHALLGDLDEAWRLLDLAEQRDGAAGHTLYTLHTAVDRLEIRVRQGGDGLAGEADRLAHQAEQRGLAALAQRARRAVAPARALTLSARQRAVLCGLAGGDTYQQVADALGFSHSTVRKDVLDLYDALGVHDRDEAVRIAGRLGLLRSGGAATG